MSSDDVAKELARVQDVLRAVHDPLAMLQGIFALAPFALQVYRADGRSMFVNRAFREMFGSEPPPGYDIFADEVVAKAGLAPLVKRAFAGEIIHVPPMWYDPGELEHVDAPAKRIAQEAWMLPLLDADGRVAHIALVAKDVTAEMTAKEAARREATLRAVAERARTRVARLQEVTSGLAQSLTPLDVAKVVLEHGLRALGATRGALHVVTPGEPALELVAAVGFDEAATEAMRRWPLSAPSAACHAVRTNEPQLLEHLASFPLGLGGPAAGALTFDLTDEDTALDEDDHAFALALARQAAQALERARLFRAAQDAAHRAGEASRAKDEFLSVLSHELRTPLNAIQGWVHLIATQRETDPHVVERGVEVIARSVKAQATLVDDLLDMARIIRGKLRLALADVDLATVVAAAVETVQPSAEAKGVTLDVDVPSGTTVLADADRLQQVVWNLLSNAIKFTPRGGRVSVRAARRDDSVSVGVSDTGQGLAPEDIRYVFDRFRQVDSTSTRAKGGLGLGLAIVRHLVEAHGGRVRAASAGPGQGATFELELPTSRRLAPEREGAHAARAEGPPAERPAAAASPRVSLAGVRVLAVDDESDAVELVSIVLGQQGAEVRTAGSVPQALEVLRAWTPDLLVSDIGMPGEDGFALMRRVRELGAPHADIPAIALTAFARREDADAARRAGFGWHLAKPVEPRVLVRVAAHAVDTMRR